MCEHYQKYILNDGYNYCPECGEKINITNKDIIMRKFTGIKFASNDKNHIFISDDFSNKIKELEDDKSFINDNNIYIVYVNGIYFNKKFCDYHYIYDLEFYTLDEFLDKYKKYKFIKYFHNGFDNSFQSLWNGICTDKIKIKNKLYFIGNNIATFNTKMILSEYGSINKSDVLDMLIEYNNLNIS